MYESFELFQAEALECGNNYYSDLSLQRDKMSAAYKIYRKAKAGTALTDFDGNPVNFGITIVGRLALRNEDGGWIASDESFPSIDEVLKENLITLDEGNPDQGSILSAKNWSLLANDSWLLGGIHARTEFHFASPLRWENFWDTPGKRMTINAREVIGITASGYRIIKPYPQLEALAVCADSGKAAKASLLSYKKSVQKFDTLDELRRFYETIPIAARQ